VLTGNAWVSKQGNALLRYLLVEAAQAATRCNPDWRRRQGGYGAQIGSSVVLDVAQRLGIFAVRRVRFARGRARNRAWRELERRALDWASRSLQREFEEVIMVEILIGEMFGSD
jgi:hypothetical protein